MPERFIVWIYCCKLMNKENEAIRSSWTIKSKCKSNGICIFESSKKKEGAEQDVDLISCEKCKMNGSIRTVDF